MNTQAITRTLFLAGMVAASAAFAGADVNKCIAPGGHVTLTDEVCPDGTETIKLVTGMAEDSGAAPAPTAAHYGARLPARPAALARTTAPSRGLALDVATLKAARANLHVIDMASQALRSQRLAGLP